MKTESITVTIVGGGASAHTLIPMLYAANYHVNLLTRKPELWSKQVELQYQTANGEVIKKFRGHLAKISSDPKGMIAESDVVILCMPVSQYRKALHNIGPFLNKKRKTYIGTVYGQAGFNWMVDELKKDFKLKNVITFCFGLIPWICRVKEYGKVGITYGIKPINVVAVEPREEFEELNRIFLSKICNGWFGQTEVRQAEKFISLTFSVDNQIIHPARCYGLITKHGGEWQRVEDIPYFYRDFDQFSADILFRLDADYSKVREAIREKYPQKKFKYMMDYLTQDQITNKTDEYNIVESFRLSKTLGAIKPPTIKTKTGTYKININHRFFTDDIHYGLCIAKWAADRLDIEVPTIDEIINWAQGLRNEVLIENGKLKLDSFDLNQKYKSGIPYFYGYQTIDDIVD
jgi:hypothetical protein